MLDCCQKRTKMYTRSMSLSSGVVLKPFNCPPHFLVVPSLLRVGVWDHFFSFKKATCLPPGLFPPQRAQENLCGNFNARIFEVQGPVCVCVCVSVMEPSSSSHSYATHFIDCNISTGLFCTHQLGTLKVWECSKNILEKQILCHIYKKLFFEIVGLLKSNFENIFHSWVENQACIRIKVYGVVLRKKGKKVNSASP